MFDSPSFNEIEDAHSMAAESTSSFGISPIHAANTSDDLNNMSISSAETQKNLIQFYNDLLKPIDKYSYLKVSTYIYNKDFSKNDEKHTMINVSLRYFFHELLSLMQDSYYISCQPVFDKISALSYLFNLIVNDKIMEIGMQFASAYKDNGFIFNDTHRTALNELFEIFDKSDSVKVYFAPVFASKDSTKIMTVQIMNYISSALTDQNDVAISELNICILMYLSYICNPISYDNNLPLQTAFSLWYCGHLSKPNKQFESNDTNKSIDMFRADTGKSSRIHLKRAKLYLSFNDITKNIPMWHEHHLNTFMLIHFISLLLWECDHNRTGINSLHDQDLMTECRLLLKEYDNIARHFFNLHVTSIEGVNVRLDYSNYLNELIHIMRFNFLKFRSKYVITDVLFNTCLDVLFFSVVNNETSSVPLPLAHYTQLYNIDNFKLYTNYNECLNIEYYTEMITYSIQSLAVFVKNSNIVDITCRTLDNTINTASSKKYKKLLNSVFKKYNKSKQEYLELRQAMQSHKKFVNQIHDLFVVTYFRLKCEDCQKLFITPFVNN